MEGFDAAKNSLCYGSGLESVRIRLICASSTDLDPFNGTNTARPAKICEVVENSHKKHEQ